MGPGSDGAAQQSRNAGSQIHPACRIALTGRASIDPQESPQTHRAFDREVKIARDPHETPLAIVVLAPVLVVCRSNTQPNNSPSAKLTTELTDRM